ncbi:MAG: tetratricopeptide repeat protein [Chitinophagales bacterium]|nr:tetratricopeptide repeat protein [Chitinophagales bacterium]
MKYLISFLLCCFGLATYAQPYDKAQRDSMLNVALLEYNELMRVTPLEEKGLIEKLEKAPTAKRTIELYYSIANKHLYSGALDKAEACFTDIMRRYPNHYAYGNARAGLAVITLERGDTLTAIQMLEAYIADETMDFLCKANDGDLMLFGNPDIQSKNYACRKLLGVYLSLNHSAGITRCVNLINGKYSSDINWDTL